MFNTEKITKKNTPGDLNGTFIRAYLNNLTEQINAEISHVMRLSFSSI